MILVWVRLPVAILGFCVSGGIVSMGWMWIPGGSSGRLMHDLFAVELAHTVDMRRNYVGLQ